MDYIDLRSDTVTRPCAGMRRAMAEAVVGDDVLGDDPTVKRLEEKAAELLGTEAAVFAPSGTQSNLIGVMSHCGRGDEYIVGQHAHTYIHEAGGAAVLGAIQPQPLDQTHEGLFDLHAVAGAIKPDDPHYARTVLLCIENTYNGHALPLPYLEQVRSFVKEEGLKLHLDGARLFNAAIKRGVSAAELAEGCDSVSICLSKGLGAPAGSVLCSSVETVRQARRWRKMLGGGMRQVGILAAAGLYALEHNIGRLKEDHEKAALLASGLREIDGIEVDYGDSQTNMVFVSVDERTAEALPGFMKENGILILGGKTVRLVVHLDVTEEAIRKTVEVFKKHY